jgi:hypothetical protein
MRTLSSRSSWSIRSFTAGIVLAAGARAPLGAETPDVRLVMTPLAPCRIVDTREAPDGSLRPGQARQFFVGGATRDYSSQGGVAAGCGIPGREVAGDGAARRNVVRAVVVNLHAAGSAEAGELEAWASGKPRPRTALLSFPMLAGAEEANASTILPICDELASDPCASGDLRVRSSRAVDVMIDVVGYFVEERVGVRTVHAGRGLVVSGPDALGEMTLSLDAVAQLPLACQPGQLPRWDGSQWACSNGAAANATLAGDVVGASDANTVATVGGQSAASVAAAAVQVTAATSAATPSTLVRRDGAGGLAAALVSASGFRLPTGAAAGRVLTSDATGNAAWTAVSCPAPPAVPPSGLCGSTCVAEDVTRLTFRDAAGNCTLQVDLPCEPFTCDAGTGTCENTCSSNAECATGSTCAANGQCTSAPARCADAVTAQGPDGTLTDCLPFVCQSGQCRSHCLSNGECGTGFDCDLTTYLCRPTP